MGARGVGEGCPLGGGGCSFVFLLAETPTEVRTHLVIAWLEGWDCDGPREPQGPKSKSSSKVGFGGIQEIGRKAGPKAGFTVKANRKTYFRTYFLTYFLYSPKPTFELLLGDFFFLISGLVAHVGRHKFGRPNAHSCPC